MEKYRKKEIIETVDLLIEGNNYISNNFRTGQVKITIEILTQCQEMAILLGNSLESLGEQGEALVPILEDYCEKIYQISQNLSDKYACRKITKKTVKQLAYLKSELISNLPAEGGVVV